MENTDGLKWFKSTHSGNGGDCVEIADAGDMVLVRDTKDRDRPHHSFTKPEWRAFIAGAKVGEFDL